MVTDLQYRGLGYRAEGGLGAPVVRHHVPTAEIVPVNAVQYTADIVEHIVKGEKKCPPGRSCGSKVERTADNPRLARMSN